VETIFLFAALFIQQLLFAALAGLPLSAGAVLLVVESSLFIALVAAFLRVRSVFWIAFAATLLIYADLLFFRYFRDAITISALSMAGQIPSVLRSVAALIRPSDLFFLPVVLLAVYTPSGKPMSRWITAPLVLFLGTGLGLTVRGVQIVDDERLLQQIYSNERLITRVGLLNFHMHNVWTHARRFWEKPAVTEAERENTARVLRAVPKSSPNDPAFGLARGRNIIVIVEESFQGFLVDLRVEGQEITPNLNKLCAAGVYADRFYDQTAGGRSADSEAAAMASLFPPRDGIAAFRYPMNSYVTLANQLDAHGYETLYAYPYHGAFWNRRVMSQRWGFAHALFDTDFSTGEVVGWGLSDDGFFSQLTPRLKALPSPFFAFLLTLSNHHPYDLPEERKTLKFVSLDENEKTAYLQSAHYADAALGRFIAELKKNGLYDSSVIVVYGDHDARMLMENRPAVDIALEDRVPFVVRAPGLKPQRLHSPAGLIDIAPTILHLAGIVPQGNGFLGSSIFIPGRPPVAWRNGSATDGKRIYLNEDGGGCFTVPEGERQSEVDCAGLRQSALERLAASDIIYKLGATDSFK
jgi:phosphoglycerol transferase MdoB-like AlkP superfamily enzyme